MCVYYSLSRRRRRRPIFTSVRLCEAVEKFFPRPPVRDSHRAADGGRRCQFVSRVSPNFIFEKARKNYQHPISGPRALQRKMP